MAITDWPEDERPRERLLKQGAASLSDAELLAIFLRVGVAGKSAVDLAREMANHFGDLARLFDASQQEFCAIPGLGPAKYAQLQAVLEMARRAMQEKMRDSDALNSPAAVKDYLRLTLGRKGYEVFAVLFLDAQNRPIAIEELFRGTLTQTIGLSARSRQARAAPQCRERDPGPQPSFRHVRAEQCRPDSHPGLEKRPGAHRYTRS